MAAGIPMGASTQAPWAGPPQYGPNPPPLGFNAGGANPGAGPAGNLGPGGLPPYLAQGQNYLSNVLSGQYLNPQSNQYLQAYYNAAALPMIQNFQQAIDPSILGGAVKAGNLFGSAPQQQESFAQSSLAQGLGNLAANIYEPAYQAERQMQQGALGMLPQTAQAQYLPAQMLGQAGQQQQQLQSQIMQWPLQAMGFGAGLIPDIVGSSGRVSVGGQSGLK